jgi:hypothetical protein
MHGRVSSGSTVHAQDPNAKVQVGGTRSDVDSREGFADHQDLLSGLEITHLGDFDDRFGVLDPHLEA